MAKERSGTPTGDDSGDLHDLFGNPATPGGAAGPPRQKKAPPPPKTEAPVRTAADGWPTWMGDADPSLAPAPAPIRPKAAPKPAAPVSARAPAAAAQRSPAK